MATDSRGDVRTCKPVYIYLFFGRRSGNEIKDNEYRLDGWLNQHGKSYVLLYPLKIVKIPSGSYMLFVNVYFLPSYNWRQHFSPYFHKCFIGTTFITFDLLSDEN